MRFFVRAFVACAAVLLPSAASSQVVLHTVGDLPGGPNFSLIRDVVKVGGVIYGVGGGAAKVQPCTPSCVTDTAVLWTWDGATASLTALPDIVANPGNSSSIFAGAISGDAAYIASQVHASSPGLSRVAVRVTRVGLVNLNLNAAPYTVFGTPNGASAISNNGAILYGTASSGGFNRAVRYDTIAGTSTLIPLLNPGDQGNLNAFRATSSGGAVMAGVSFVTPYAGTTNGRAFRYVDGVGVSAIPLLGGGTWNRALAVTPNGLSTLVAGNSTAFPKGELYVHNATTGTAIPKGSPSSAWEPTGFGGFTPDGSVIVVTYGDPAPTVERQAYFHNSHGWYNLAAALAAGGVDLLASGFDGDDMVVAGISADGTLVWGSVSNGNGDSEGFVAEFPAGFLANFNPLPVPPANKAIVGSWLFTDPDPNRRLVVTFVADGTFSVTEAIIPAGNETQFNGFDNGVYTWDANTGALRLTTLQDTSGSGGLSFFDGVIGIRATVVGNELSVDFLQLGCVPDPGDPCVYTATRVHGGTSSIVGTWLFATLSSAEWNVLTFMSDGTYFFTAGGPPGDPSGQTGIEVGTYTWAPGSLVSTATLDQNGGWGPSGTAGTPSVVNMTLSADGLSIIVDKGGGSVLVGQRIHAPRAPVVDLNGDGTGDVFLYATSTGQWALETTTAGGSFTQTSGAWGPNWTVKPARFNNDARTDMFLFNTTNGQWFKMLDDGAGGWTVEGFAAWGTNWQRFVVDLNGDGLSDLFLWDPTLGTWFKCLATAGGFTYTQGFWSLGWEVYPMRFNNDALQDFFLFNRTNGQWFWVLGDPGGGFTYPQFAAWSPIWQFYPGDYNGDGLSDLLLFHPASGQLFVALNSAGNFTYTFGTFTTGWSIYPQDLDANGRTDLLLHSPSSGQWFQMISNGSGAFTVGGTGGWSLGWNVYPTDFNDDGRGDLLLYNVTTGQWFQARNVALGNYTYTSGGWSPGLTIVARQPPQ